MWIHIRCSFFSNHQFTVSGISCCFPIAHFHQPLLWDFHLLFLTIDWATSTCSHTLTLSCLLLPDHLVFFSTRHCLVIVYSIGFSAHHSLVWILLLLSAIISLLLFLDRYSSSCRYLVLASNCCFHFLVWRLHHFCFWSQHSIFRLLEIKVQFCFRIMRLSYWLHQDRSTSFSIIHCLDWICWFWVCISQSIEYI